MPRPEKMYMYVARVTDLGRNPWRFCPNSSDPHPEIPIPTAIHNQRLQGLIHMWHTCIVLFSIGSLTNNDPVSRWSSGKSQAYRPGGSFNKKIIPSSQFHKKSESHQRSRSHFATPLVVLYRKWANELGAKWPNWNTNFARIFCKANAKIGLKILATF